jgi:hypothetical protein
VIKAGIVLCILFIITGFSSFAENGVRDHSGLNAALLQELNEKVKLANIPQSTLNFVLTQVDTGVLPQERGQAVKQLLDLVKRYDAQLRKGASYSRLRLELKQELALDKLDKDKKVKVKAASVIKAKKKITAEKATEKNAKEIKAVKEKIKEKKEKKEKEKINSSVK